MSANVSAAQLTFSPRLTLSEEYTDNLYRTRDDREEEFIFRVSPGATLGIVGQRSELSLSYDPYYSDYHNNTDLSRWSHAAGLDAYSQFTRNTRGYLNSTFIYTEDPEYDESAGGRTGRDPYYTSTSIAGVTNQFGPRNQITLQYTHREFREETDPSDDSTTYSPELMFDYWFSSNWGFESTFRYTKGVFAISDNFENYFGSARILYNHSRRWDWFVRYSQTAMRYEEVAEDDYSLYYPSLGFDYTYDENAFLSLEAGPLVREWVDRIEDYGVFVFADGTKRWPFRQGSFSVSIRNGIDYDYASTENRGLYYYSGIDGGVDYQFTRNLSGNVVAAYTYDAYVDLAPERHDNTYTAGAGLAWLPAHWCRIGLDYSYRDIRSNIEESEYYENRVYLGVSFFPRRPYYLIR